MSFRTEGIEKEEEERYYVGSSYIREYDLEFYCKAISTTSLNMRDSASLSGGIIASIPSQSFFPILVEMIDWDYVLYGNLDGYVSTDYIFRIHY